MHYFFSLPEEKKERIVARFNEQARKDPSGCWLWSGSMNNYCKFTILTEGRRSIGMWAHRFSWMLHYKTPIPKGLLCCHSCDVKECVNPQHIFLGTSKDNARDSMMKDRRKRFKLEQRFRLVEDLIAGSTFKEINEKYKVRNSVIYSYLRSREIVAKYGNLSFKHRLSSPRGNARRLLNQKQ